MHLFIENIQEKVTVTEKTELLIKETVRKSLQLQGFERDTEISLLLVDDDKIRDINRQQRSVDKSTDVLSFPILNIVEGKIESCVGDFDVENDILLLGDIVVSLETTSKQADKYGHSFERELAFLVTHGVFHLLGYDHEDDEQEKRMISRQEEVLNDMGLNR